MALPSLNSDFALLLDVDGTLLDIAPTPDSVMIPGSLRTNLADLYQGLGGAVALVSGRSIAKLDRLFAPLRLPAAGQHGAEIRLTARSDIDHGRPSVRLESLCRRLTDFSAMRPGIVVEEKGLSVAAHYRNAVSHRDELERFIRDCIGDDETDLEILEAQMAFDIKPRHVNKGTAVGRFMEVAPFRGRRPVFIGDDRTDEDGFAAALALSGEAIRVGPGAPSIARHCISSPARLREWLRTSARRLTIP
jgi:trehalose 6-phosphate phosphatase